MSSSLWTTSALRANSLKEVDPGVQESEDEDQMAGFTRYADEEDFLKQLSNEFEANNNESGAAQRQQGEKEDLPLTGDYHGMGGPHSVPLESAGAFSRPASALPHRSCILDELFMAPSADQIAAYGRVEAKRNK